MNVIDKMVRKERKRRYKKLKKLMKARSMSRKHRDKDIRLSRLDKRFPVYSFVMARSIKWLAVYIYENRDSLSRGRPLPPNTKPVRPNPRWKKG